MTLALKEKFADPTRGVYLIGTCPPKAGTEPNTVNEIADKLLARLTLLEFDGMIVYDIQDESSRIDAPRPFPFMATLDPREYSALLRKKSSRPIITYKSVSQRNASDFSKWLSEAWDTYGVRDMVMVGSPSADSDIKLSLNDAYKVVAQDERPFNLGGVTIAERHLKKGEEHQRLLQKSAQGCSFFVSQAVYNAQATIDMLTRYAHECQAHNIQPARIILTFTPCGSAKTMEFMDWLGISIPEGTRLRILNAEDSLAESIRVCRGNLEQIMDAVLDLGLPLGLNIESLTNRKDEIDASIRLFKLLKASLDLRLAEQQL
ncbi:MAG: methylenetetrahydrofolate reductase [Pontibacterium sp.]